MTTQGLRISFSATRCWNVTVSVLYYTIVGFREIRFTGGFPVTETAACLNQAGHRELSDLLRLLPTCAPFWDLFGAKTGGPYSKRDPSLYGLSPLALIWAF